MPPFVLKSLRGGLNNSDDPIAIADDQCTTANNVEFHRSMLGSRRRGTAPVTLHASMASKDRVTFLGMHFPSVDETAVTLWVLGVTGTASYRLDYKDTSWHNVTIADTVSLANFDQYRWQAVSLHGKMFFAFNSDVDRLHVFDGQTSTLRRVGIAAASSAPTGANTAAGGSFSITRYYRVRFTRQTSGITDLRSEPSPVLTFSPSGSKTGVTVTCPTAPGEAETHWELEASLDNVNFYRIATTVVATTTVDDTQDGTTGYAQSFTLSEDIQDYTLLGSARYLTIDADRLIWAGSYEDDNLGSRVGWTPVRQASGVGNDERQELDTDPTVDLDGYEGGSITGLSNTAAGSFFAFKLTHIYKLVRTGARSAAYDVVVISKDRGALHGSVITGVDQLGRPTIYFLDPNVGPCRYGSNGLEWCGSDIRNTWGLVNKDATKVVCCGYYDPVNRQVVWNISTSGENTPNLSIVLQTEHVRSSDDGTHKGWATWDGIRSQGICCCLFPDNIEANTTRSRVLRPYIGLEGNGLVQLCDTGTKDNSATAYTATIVSKPYILSTILDRMGVRVGSIMAKAVAGVTFAVQVIRDFGKETSTAISVSTAPSSAGESNVIVPMDNLKMAEAVVCQFKFVDNAASTISDRWELNQLAVGNRQEQTA